MYKGKPIGSTPPQFSVGDALRHGLTPAQTKRVRFVAPFHGVRAIEPGESLLERCRILRVKLPDSAFYCGPTAAQLHGLPLPASFADERMHVAVPAPRNRVERKGVRGRSLGVAAADVVERDGVRVTTPIRTWCDLAGEIAEDDLVAAADHLLHHGLATADQLGSAASSYPDRRRRGQLLAAIVLANGRAESPPETLIRLALQRAGIGPLAVNVDIRDADGRFVARPDLSLRAHRIAIEYLGDYHRVEKGRWRKDRARAGRMRALGWQVIELTGDDLPDLAAAVATVWAAVRG